MRQTLISYPSCECKPKHMHAGKPLEFRVPFLVFGVVVFENNLIIVCLV
jgi:hypothetical protein